MKGFLHRLRLIGLAGIPPPGWARGDDGLRQHKLSRPTVPASSRNS
jgi:hypothetical protein